MKELINKRDASINIRNEGTVLKKQKRAHFNQKGAFQTSFLCMFKAKIPFLLFLRETVTKQ